MSADAQALRDCGPFSRWPGGAPRCQQTPAPSQGTSPRCQQTQLVVRSATLDDRGLFAFNADHGSAPLGNGNTASVRGGNAAARRNRITASPKPTTAQSNARSN